MRPLPPEADPGRWHTIVPPPGDWRLDGACHDQPFLTSKLFYPPGELDFGWGDPTVLAAGRQAKAICSQCPVGDDCHEYAMQTNQLFGVWAGRTPPERRRDRRAWLTQRSRLESRTSNR